MAHLLRGFVVLYLEGSDSATNSHGSAQDTFVCVYTYTYSDTMLMSWSIQKYIVPSCDFQKIKNFINSKKNILMLTETPGETLCIYV